MKKKVFVVLGILMSIPAFAIDFAFTYEGQTLDYAVVDEEKKWVEISNNNEKIVGELIIPSVVKHDGEDFSVVSIAEDAFRGSKEMTSVEIPATVTAIGAMAFNGCDGLKKAGFASVAQMCSMEYGHEYSNPLLLANKLFIGGEEVKEIIIPDSISSIGNYAFNGGREITSVYIPSSVISIGDYAFKGCNGLIHADIPESVVSYGRGIFYGCIGLASVKLPSTIPSIGREMFYACGNLERIDIPNSVTSVGNLAFYYCKGLTEISIPESVSLIEGSAFEGCRGLERVELPASLTSIRTEAFRNCSGLKSIAIPDSVVSIGNGAFNGCSSLVSVSLPEKVIYLGERSFMNCSQLEEIILPPGLEIIRGEAFRNSVALKKVVYQGDVPLEGDENIFEGEVYENATLIVGYGLKDEFVKVSPWKFFSFISEISQDSDTTSIDELSEEVSGFDFFKPVETYTLQGIEVSNSINALPSGIYIIRQGKKVRKIKVNGVTNP